MENEPTNTPPAGGDPAPGGNGGNDPAPPSGDDAIKALLAKNAELLSEKKKMRDRLDELETHANKAREMELAEKERYKELWEEAKSKLEESNSKLSALTGRITDAKKFSAFQKEVGQQIDEKYHALIDIDKIVADDSGSIDLASVKAYAETWKATYGDLFKPAGAPPNDYPNGDGGSDEIPSMSEWKELNKRDPKKAKELLPLVFKKHGDNVGRGGQASG